mgnify:CR=1 FL=1
MFQGEPLSEPPQDLVEQLTGILQCLAAYIMVMEKIFLTYEWELPTQKGKNFLANSMQQVFEQCNSLANQYPEYDLSLSNLTWEMMGANMKAFSWALGNDNKVTELLDSLNSALGYALLI